MASLGAPNALDLGKAYLATLVVEPVLEAFGALIEQFEKHVVGGTMRGLWSTTADRG